MKILDLDAYTLEYSGGSQTRSGLLANKVGDHCKLTSQDLVVRKPERPDSLHLPEAFITSAILLAVVARTVDLDDEPQFGR